MLFFSDMSGFFEPVLPADGQLVFRSRKFCVYSKYSVFSIQRELILIGWGIDHA